MADLSDYIGQHVKFDWDHYRGMGIVVGITPMHHLSIRIEERVFPPTIWGHDDESHAESNSDYLYWNITPSQILEVMYPLMDAEGNLLLNF